MKSPADLRLPKGRPATLTPGMPWRFTHLKTQVHALDWQQCPSNRRPHPIQLGWDEGPKLDRIAWLSVARSLIESGDCFSYVGAQELIPWDGWSIQELAALDHARLESRERQRRGGRPPRWAA